MTSDQLFDSQDSDGCGCECWYFSNGDGTGTKIFRLYSIAITAYRWQNWAYKHDLGPQVLSDLRVYSFLDWDKNEIEQYGFITEEVNYIGKNVTKKHYSMKSQIGDRYHDVVGHDNIGDFHDGNWGILIRVETTLWGEEEKTLAVLIDFGTHFERGIKWTNESCLMSEFARCTKKLYREKRFNYSIKKWTCETWKGKEVDY